MSELYKLITIDQLRKLEHTIGFSRREVKRNKYTAFRNYYCDSCNNEELDKLVVLGLMEKREKLGSVIYFVTDKGFEFIECVESMQIVRGEN